MFNFLNKVIPRIVDVYLDDRATKRINSLLYDYENATDEQITADHFFKLIVEDFISNLARASTDDIKEKLELLKKTYDYKHAFKKTTILINSKMYDRLVDLENELFEDCEFDISIDHMVSLLVIDFLKFVKKDKNIFYKLLGECDDDY